MRNQNNRASIWRTAVIWLPVLLVFMLWVPNLFATYTSDVVGRLRFLEAAALGLFFWFMCVAVLVRLWLALALALPVALIWPLELWVRVNNGTPISVHLVALALESNWAEGANFFSAYGTGLAVLALCWLVLYGVGLWWAWRLDVCWRHRSRLWFLAVFLPMLALFYHSSDTQDALASEFRLDVMDDSGVSGWGSQWEDVFPVNLVVSIDHFQQQQSKLQSVQATLASQTLQAQQQRSPQNPEVVVLVIGESASAARWNMLGYNRDTNPRLAELPGLALFSDVVALSTATRTAVPGVLSRRPVLWPDGHVDLKAEPSLIRAFAEAGYQTHWVSNQSPLGQHDTSISVYAREAQDVRFLNPATYQYRSSEDGILLPPLHAILSQPGRHLVVLHLLGSHFDYSLRYPSSFDYFKPSLQTAEPALVDSADYASQVDNSYDNSLRYTDHVLAEVIAAVQKRHGNAMVGYFSDHGVDAVQGVCASKSATRRSEAAYRVPAFIWMSESLRAQDNIQWQRLQENTHQPYTTRALFSTLLGLSGIDIAGGLPEESFLRQHRPKTEPRLVASNGGRLVDFDVARKKNACFIAAD